LDGVVKKPALMEKKNLQFGIRIEPSIAKIIKTLSRQSKLSVGDIVRLCVDRQLKSSEQLLGLAREKRDWSLGVKFDGPMVGDLQKISRKTGLTMAELIRLCVLKQLEQIRREGGIKLKLDPDAG
jgi:hypothetical protein